MEDDDRLLIVIPAYNEEESLAGTIGECLAAKKDIIEKTQVTAVDITVVSDGSTDGTEEIARGFGSDISVIAFQTNRGYGAAIKEGFKSTNAGLVGFIDADGTCDAGFFVKLCQMIYDGADVALGSRIHEKSRMPVHRKLGNILFAMLMSLFSSSRVNDIASGMRVIRASALPDLYPLPDDLHFTPSMSAKAILSKKLIIAESPMPYHERGGSSKLRAGRHGYLFLKSILETALLFNPTALLGITGAACIAASLALMAYPGGFYITNLFLEEWMIYRFIFAHMLGVAGLLLLGTGYICHRIVSIAIPSGPKEEDTGILRAMGSRTAMAAMLALLAFGVALVAPSLLERIATGHTDEHWSRYVVTSYLFTVAAILFSTRIVDHALCLVSERLEYLRKVNK